MDVHLIDGTYELFRHYYALPSARDANGMEVAAVRGVVASILSMVRAPQSDRGRDSGQGATHVGVATDHVIESFRNELWRDYKTSQGIDADLLLQFPLLEEAIAALGVRVWPMVEFEADDALAAAAEAAARDVRVPTTLPWSATRLTDTRGCPVGAPSRPPLCSRATGISKGFRQTGERGA